MNELDNIDIFALCVAEIMDELYTAFPIPTDLSASRVAASFEPSPVVSQPRLVQPGDADYQELFPLGFSEFAGLAIAAREDYQPQLGAKMGEPFQYWTEDQRQVIAKCRARSRNATRIHKETVNFLVREGYITEISPPNSEQKSDRGTLVLTSKGFAHLNKKFEKGTIRDEFHFRTAKTIVDAIKAADVVNMGASHLVHTLVSFLS